MHETLRGLDGVDSVCDVKIPLRHENTDRVDEKPDVVGKHGYGVGLRIVSTVLLLFRLYRRMSVILMSS